MTIFDGIGETELLKSIQNWQHPENNPCYQYLLARKSMAKDYHSISIINHLYGFIRANIKRGRNFDLRQVLTEGTADCLGYSKLFTLAGRMLGLDTGVIEVVIDNQGRPVPHTAILVHLTHHRWRLVDLWYGSKNIQHVRLGLQVKQNGVWRIEDADLVELDSVEDVSFLPDTCVDAITYYVLGNRSLKRRDFKEAVSYYSRAIKLYPQNARAYYNRAIAYENLGEQQKANNDYAQALSDDASIIRVMAREQEEITLLLNLDSQGISEREQEMCLLHKGFTTGENMPIEKVARKFGLSVRRTKAMLSSIEAKLRA